jgi:cysteine desulfurase/selenocysteine lyase
MARFGVPGTARISFAYYNTFEEIDSCIIAINKAKNMLL